MPSPGGARRCQFGAPSGQPRPRASPWIPLGADEPKNIQLGITITYVHGYISRFIRPQTPLEPLFGAEVHHIRITNSKPLHPIKAKALYPISNTLRIGERLLPPYFMIRVRCLPGNSSYRRIILTKSLSPKPFASSASGSRAESWSGIDKDPE